MLIESYGRIFLIIIIIIIIINIIIIIIKLFTVGINK